MSDNVQRIGPFHYEGWTCDGCMMLMLDYETVTGGYCKSHEQSIQDTSDTPNWCPYIRSAIIEHNVEES